MPKPKRPTESPAMTPAQSTESQVETPAPDRAILVDSRVVAASPKGQRDLKQIRSPTITFLPIAGVQVWSTDPGLNVHITSDTWDAYKAKHRQVSQMMGSGQLRRLDSLPPDPDQLEGLVERTISVPALEFVLDKLTTGEADYGGGLRQASLIKLTEERIARAHPVTVETTRWRPREERPASSQFVM